MIWYKCNIYVKLIASLVSRNIRKCKGKLAIQRKIWINSNHSNRNSQPMGKKLHSFMKILLFQEGEKFIL